MKHRKLISSFSMIAVSTSVLAMMVVPSYAAQTKTEQKAPIRKMVNHVVFPAHGNGKLTQVEINHAADQITSRTPKSHITYTLVYTFQVKDKQTNKSAITKTFGVYRDKKYLLVFEIGASTSTPTTNKSASTTSSTSATAKNGVTTVPSTNTPTTNTSTSSPTSSAGATTKSGVSASNPSYSDLTALGMQANQGSDGNTYYYFPQTWQNIWNWQGFSGTANLGDFVWVPQAGGFYQNGKSVWSTSVIAQAFPSSSPGISQGGDGLTIANGMYQLGFSTPDQFGTAPGGPMMNAMSYFQSGNDVFVSSSGNTDYMPNDVYIYTGNTKQILAMEKKYAGMSNDGYNVSVTITAPNMDYSWGIYSGNVGGANINNLSTFNQVYNTVYNWIKQNGGIESLGSNVQYSVDGGVTSPQLLTNKNFEGMFLALSELFKNPNSMHANALDNASVMIATLPPVGTPLNSNGMPVSMYGN